MTIGYYPGCSLHATSREFDESVRAVAAQLGCDLREVDDWSCCGASSAHATDHLLGVALPARNLALAQEQGHEEVLAPCAACYNRLLSAQHELAHDPALNAKVAAIVDRPLASPVAIRNIVELLLTYREEIAKQAGTRLKGLKIACYYGCLLVRPPEVCNFDDPEQPMSMDTLVKACGASAVAWSSKVACCGGGFSLSRTSSVVRLGREILDDARNAGADAIVVACPMCHSNLDFRQNAIRQRGESAIPVLFITQLAGLVLGIAPAKLGLPRHFVPTAALTEKLAAAAAQ